MRQMRDIRQYKEELRRHYREERQALEASEKQLLDRQIAQRFFRLRQYRANSILLIYVSTPIEVDTRKMIERALKDGKRVAVPRCIPNTRDMEFYFITSFDDLESGAFGVLEPIPKRCEKLVDESKGLCVIPAFCFDYNGYRLGYGKGYYDRFLSRFGGMKVGICYSSGVRYRLYHSRFDCAVDLIVTEKYIRKTGMSSVPAKHSALHPHERKNQNE